MEEAVIVSMQRTPLGKFRKTLAAMDAMELGALAAKKCVEKAHIDPAVIDNALIGNLYNVNHSNMARKIILAAGFPVEIPATTVDHRCSSSLEAAAYAAMLINTGNAEVILTGGVESYSQQPLLIKNPSEAYPSVITPLPYTNTPESFYQNNIQTAENLATRHGITREECDAFALRSHKLAADAWNNHRFDEQVFPVEIPQRKGEPIKFAVDECVRFDATLEALAKLRPVMPGGVVTAGNASPMNDGAAMVLIMSAERAKQYGLEPLGKITGYATAGVDPRYMGYGPVAATRKLFSQTGLTMKDFDLVELNEAFAAQTLPCARDLDIPDEILNVNGGAIAIGHPNAASGAILIGRLIYEMKARNAKRGLVTFCCGGGMGSSLVIEKC